MVLRAIEIYDGSIDMASTARARISSNRSETIGIPADEEEMIAAIRPEMNARLCNT